MESQELALIALRVLSGWTGGDITESTDDVKTLRAHALPDETDLPLDELACCIVGRACAKVINESQFDRKAIESDAYRDLKKVG